jgi:hypothetical protein
MKRTLFIAFVVAVICASVAHAECPELFIWDVLKRPAYAESYKRIVATETHLPDWLATSSNLARSVTTGAASIKIVGENEYESFSMCKSHECDGSKSLVLFFGQHGEVVKGVLRDNRKLRFFGYPTNDERAALLNELQPEPGYSTN